MKCKTIILWIICIILGIPAIPKAQNTDLPGSHDYSLVPRLSGFYIGNYDENRYDFENFKVNDGEKRVEGHKYVIDYYLPSNKTPQGKSYILQRYADILEGKGAKLMFKGPYYSVYKIPRSNSETWIKVDPGNYDGKRYALTIVEKKAMAQEVSSEAKPAYSAHENDVAGSKDYPMLSRMPDFYIGQYEELPHASETFKTANGNIPVEGHEFSIDYYLEAGKTPPGKIQILENYKTVLLNAKAEILLDGAYYDVYKVQNNGGETWIKIDPGNYDGKRYEITVLESTATNADSGDLSMAPDSGKIQFQSLKVTEAGGKPLLRANSADIEAPKKFFFKKPQKVNIHTQIKNDSEKIWENGMVEFRVDGEVTGTYVIPSLGPGEVYEIGSSYDAQEVKDHDIEVNLYDRDSPHTLASIDGQLLSENDTAEVTGFVYPDLEIRDIAYRTNPERIEVEIQNNGDAINKTAHLKAWYADPYSSFNQEYETDIPISLGPGERKWVDLISPFNWPDPIDKPKLLFTVYIDPDREITEVDERNNSLHKEVCAPCGVKIDSLSTYKLVREHGFNDKVEIMGQFGEKRASKQIAFVKKNGEIVSLDVIAYNRQRQPLNWNNRKLEIKIGNFPLGTYNIVILCSDPINNFTLPFSSNYSREFIYKKKERSLSNKIKDAFSFDGFHEGDLDARKLANALAEEFTVGLEFDSPNSAPLYCERIWTEKENNYIILNTKLNYNEPAGKLEKIVFEVWTIEPHIRKNYIEVSIDSNIQQAFVDGLNHGVYEFNARFIMIGGIETSSSILFMVQ